MGNTANRGYPKPVSENFVSDDVFLLIQAFDLIDADVAALIVALNGKAPVSHSHAMADITGLSSALAGKADASHAHAFDNIQGVSGTAAAPDGYILTKTSSGWVPGNPATILGAHTHSINQITGLSDALNAKLDPAALALASLKATPVDADSLPLIDSAASNGLKRVTWAAIKATLKAYFDTLYTAAGFGVPTGTVLDFAGGAAPTGCLLCSGQAVSRTTYAALFAVIGTTYGVGDGSTTFNVPDIPPTLPLKKVIKT